MAFSFKKKDDNEKQPEKKLSKKEKKALEKEALEREERERLIAEKNRLLQLTEKELLVEIILSLENYNKRIAKLEKAVNNAEDMAGLAAINALR